MTIVIGIITALLTGIILTFNGWILDVFTNVMNMINSLSINIWNEPIIIDLIKLSGKIAIIVLALSIPFLLKDMLEQADTLDWKVVGFSVLKAYLFTVSINIFGVMIFNIGHTLIKSLNLVVDPSQITAVVGSILGAPVLIIMVVASIVFLVMTITRIATMLIHIFTSFLYIPFIVRGDSSKAGEWITMAISISLTYTCQYFFFYLSIYLYLDSKVWIATLFLAASFLIVPALKTFGFSSGARSALSSTTSGIASTVSSIKALIR